MNYLLDTHVLLWAINEPAKLSVSIKEKIQDTKNGCYVSIVSLWEIAIKISIKKLSVEMELIDLFEIIGKSQFEILNLNQSAILQVAQLPFHHNDPFDRVLISQAQTNNLTLLTKDKAFASYSVAVEWA
ncbi:MAG: type II toxin-antitoxin system VapC family toxin [Cyclobacteriaceae bacterium]